jgi:hypothetical protein
VGEHWSARASADQTHEILISPVIDDPVRVLGILVHELAHASTDGDGHKGRFPALVKALSLEGKPTATVEGERFKAEYQPLLGGSWCLSSRQVECWDEPQGARHSDAQGLLALIAGTPCACLPSGPQSVCPNARSMALNWLFPNRLNTGGSNHERTTNPT